jgi:hypothetical protein
MSWEGFQIECWSALGPRAPRRATGWDSAYCAAFGED